MSEETTNVSVADASPRMTTRKKIEQLAGRFGLWLIAKPITTLPLPMARVAGLGLGRFLYATFGKQRRIAQKNLKLVYPETSASRRTEIAKLVFDHFGKVAAEFLKLPGMPPAEVERMVTVEGEENIRKALETKRGVLLITGHFGNWEFMAKWLACHQYPLNVVTRDARDPFATKLMTDIREGIGVKVLYRGSSARAVLRSLKSNEIVALLPDQNAADLFTPFLGVNTGTIDGPAIIHLRTGAPLLFSWCVRQPDDTFKITFEAPETVVSSGDKAADIAKVMTLINERLTVQIEKNPEQWLWLHDRWKATPGIFPDGDWNAHELKTPSNRIKQEIQEANDSSVR